MGLDGSEFVDDLDDGFRVSGVGGGAAGAVGAGLAGVGGWMPGAIGAGLAGRSVEQLHLRLVV
jgi:hypothetical protein